MNKINNKFLIVLSCVLIISGVYVYTSNTSESLAADSEGLTSSLGGSPVSDFTTPDQKITEDVSFIDTLSSLTQINIDTSLFSSKAFNDLKDNTVKLAPGATGRPNPFAPIDPNATSGTETIGSPVITNPPSQITDRTVIFNGTMNTSSGASSAYFEYGPTEALGRVTPPAEQSLIGTFIKKVVNLNPKTTYFYRASARVNGTVVFGDVVSFTTN